MNFGTKAELIPRFQFTDQWEIGAMPADFVTNIRLVIRCGAVDFDTSVNTLRNKVCDGRKDEPDY
jgi:hypothetical protein